MNGNVCAALSGSSVRAKGAELRKQRSYLHHGAAQLSRYSNSVAVRGGSRYGCGGESSANSHWPGECFNASYNHFNGGESSEKHEWSHHLLDRPKSSYKIDEQSSGKESAMVKYLVILTFYSRVYNPFLIKHSIILLGLL